MQEQSLGELLNTIFGTGKWCRRNTRPEEHGIPDLSDIRDLLEKKLRWYGWSSVKIGPFELSGDRILIALLENGKLQWRLKLDRRTGAVRLANNPVVEHGLGRPPASKPIRKLPN